MRLAAAATAAAIALRARGDMAFGVPALRPPRLAWPLLKLPWCGGRARPGQVPRVNGLAAISSSFPENNRPDNALLFSSDLVVWANRQVFHYLRLLFAVGTFIAEPPAQIRASGFPAYSSASRARRRGALGGRVETDN